MELTGTLSPSGEVGGCGGMGLGSLESPSITTLCCPHPPFSPPSHPTPVRSLSLPHPLVPCHSLSLSPFPLVPCIHPSTTTFYPPTLLSFPFTFPIFPISSPPLSPDSHPLLPSITSTQLSIHLHGCCLSSFYLLFHFALSQPLYTLST